jgi:hypothetical protein
VTSGKPIAVWSQSISGANAINPLVALLSMEERERCYSFILSRTPHETQLNNKNTTALRTSLCEMVKNKLQVSWMYVRSTARHAIHSQFVISANALEIKALQSTNGII